MSVLKTPTDLGNVIRQRRKALGWDQVRLAQETGVSRQWIIDIEKGKPRAELQLVLRTLNVLGIELDASARDIPSPAKNEKPTLVLPNIDDIVKNNRSALSYTNIAANHHQLKSLSHPQSVADAAREQLMKLTRPQSAADAAREQLMKLTRPQSAADAAREQLMKLTRPQSAADAAREQLMKLTRPQSAADAAREQLMKLTRPQSAADAAREQLMKLTRPQSAADAVREQNMKLTRPQSVTDSIRELDDGKSERRTGGKRKPPLSTKEKRSPGKEK
jgi:y4mF family transcriptional regulator